MILIHFPRILFFQSCSIFIKPEVVERINRSKGKNDENVNEKKTSLVYLSLPVFRNILSSSQVQNCWKLFFKAFLLYSKICICFYHFLYMNVYKHGLNRFSILDYMLSLYIKLKLIFKPFQNWHFSNTLIFYQLKIVQGLENFQSLD